MILIVYSGINLFIQKEFVSFLKQNKPLILFGVYIALLVTIKHIIIYFDNTRSISLFTGFGEVVYVLFGLMFFYVFSKEKIVLFSMAYVLTFTFAFIIFGRNTLYDYGNVCRTIGAYENPNVLALYACTALYMSLLLINMKKNKSKYLYIVSAGIAFACVMITTSRAMYLGILGSCLIFLFVILIAKDRKKYKWSDVFKNKITYIVLFTITTICTIVLYYPKIENATVDGTKGELANILAEREVSEKDTGQTDIEQNDVNQTEIGILNRVLSDANLSEGSTFKSNTRFKIWIEYLSHLNEYVLWGNYEGNDVMFFPEYERNYVPHNIFISILYKYGLIAFFIFIFILLKPVYIVLKERKIQINQDLLFMCMCSFAIFGMLHEATSTGIFWSIIGMLYNYQKFD